MDKAGTATVAYYAVKGQEASVRAMAEEHLKVLGLLDPECKHQGLEDAARNYMQICVGLQGNAAVEDSMITELKTANDELVDENLGLRESLKGIREDRDKLAKERDALLRSWNNMREVLGYLDMFGDLGEPMSSRIRAAIKPPELLTR